MRSVRLAGDARARSASAVVLACALLGADHPNTARGNAGAVATDQHLATLTGERVLQDGGNAVDAAIAIGYALAATYPAAGNLGGGGFMLVRLADGTTHFIDFREEAPAAATADMYLDAKGNADPERSTVGALSAGVPGTVAGLEYARERFATRSRAALLAPAIAYADGFVLDAADVREIDGGAGLLARFPSSAAIYLRDGKAPHAGERFAQPDLARTLRAISERGTDGFYKGDVARALVASVQAAGGIISLADLAAYRAVERAPRDLHYAGATIVTAPPPSSGGVALCETLGIIGAPSAARCAMRRTRTSRLEAERRAFADRSSALGDPDFVRVPVAHLLDPAYLAARARFDRTRPRDAVVGNCYPASPRTRAKTRRTIASSMPPATPSTSPIRSMPRSAVDSSRRRHGRLAQRRDGRLHEQTRRCRTCSGSCKARPMRSPRANAPSRR
jgi:gamma-glutamyltranspeptidase/glutathione hydrolase